MIRPCLPVRPFHRFIPHSARAIYRKRKVADLEVVCCSRGEARSGDMDKERNGQGGGSASEGEGEGLGELLGVQALPGIGMSFDLKGERSTGNPTNKSSSPRGR